MHYKKKAFSCGEIMSTLKTLSVRQLIITVLCGVWGLDISKVTYWLRKKTCSSYPCPEGLFVLGTDASDEASYKFGMGNWKTNTDTRWWTKLLVLFQKNFPMVALLMR